MNAAPFILNWKNVFAIMPFPFYQYLLILIFAEDFILMGLFRTEIYQMNIWKKGSRGCVRKSHLLSEGEDNLTRVQRALAGNTDIHGCMVKGRGFTSPLQIADCNTFGRHRRWQRNKNTEVGSSGHFRKTQTSDLKTQSSETLLIPKNIQIYK